MGFFKKYLILVSLFHCLLLPLQAQQLSVKDYIIKFKSTLAVDQIQGLLVRATSVLPRGGGGLRLLRTFDLDRYLVKLKLKHIRMNPKLMPFIQKVLAPYIEWIEEDELLHTTEQSSQTPISSKQWGLENSKDIDIDVTRAWSLDYDLESTVVAVIDGGVDLNHPALSNNIWRNPMEIADNGLDDDGNGFVDDYQGWDFYSDDNTPMDERSHGTHVAGIISAKSTELFGVAPGAKIMPLRFIGANGSGKTSGAIRGIYYAVANGAKIINNSWGGGSGSKALKAALVHARDKGVLVICSAGNRGINVDYLRSYPATYKLDNIVAVGAYTASGKVAGFSNYGRRNVDLFAPGDKIYSTIPQGKWALKSGTSMAAPFVSGAAALVWARYPELNYLEVKELLLGSVEKRSNLKSKSSTGGLLNAARSVHLESEVPDPPGGDDQSQGEFQVQDLEIEHKKYRRWWSRRTRYSFNLQGDYYLIDRIKSVSYTLDQYQSTRNKKVSSNQENGFKATISVPRNRKITEVLIQIQTHDGQVFDLLKKI